MPEMLATTYMGKPAPLPVSKRIGVWALGKHRYGYDVYHAPAGLDPKNIPDTAIDPALRPANKFLGYRPGLAALADIAAAFPEFNRDTDAPALRAFLDARSIQ